MPHGLPLLTTVAAGFAGAWLLGLITQRLGLSPIVGYLLAGIAIGPYTPGFSGDVAIAHQLSEIGVILMMFGVGLHFHLKDLNAVKGIAIPGAIVQSTVATLVAAWLFGMLGWPVKAGVVVGMAFAVASTVVLLRVLSDKEMLGTVHGHAAVGWLIVEDVFTVLALVVVPLLAMRAGPDGPSVNWWTSTGWAALKLGALVVVVLLAGSRVVPWILAQVALLRSRELFTLTVLVVSITVAVGSASMFGASVALGAFLAGMVVAQSPLSHQAAADALPLRDAFGVLFFVSVGMLFDPSFLLQQPLMVAAGLAVVLIAKPLAALAIVAILGYPARTALTVAVGLAQIGEFSFILIDAARTHRLVPEEASHVVVATAILSITINPLLFRSLDRIEALARKRAWLWRLLNIRADARAARINRVSQPLIARATKPLAVIVGYGPVGRVVDALLRDAGLETVIVDMNSETVDGLTKSGRIAIYGDASREEILVQAGVRRAVHLVLTLPQSVSRSDLVMSARALNPEIEITVRARFLGEGESLRQAGANVTVFEEGEAGVAMARGILRRRGVDDDTVDRMLRAIRKLWNMEP